MTTRKKRRRKTNWKNSTDWPNYFLRRMVSWVCKELQYPRSHLVDVEFGNRTNCAFSGRAWGNKLWGQILVRIGPADRFPVQSKTYRDSFTVGEIKDRMEALIEVTAHELAHCDNDRRGNKSRGRYEKTGNTGGSERLTDAMSKQVLKAFREKREELLEEWSKEPARKAKAKKVSPVEKRANNAFAKVKEWESKLKRAKTTLAKWKRKAKYYRDKYPDGEYPEPVKRKPPTPKPETVLKRKISKYITMQLKDHDLGSCKIYVHVFGDDCELTRPSKDYEWEGHDIELREARKQVVLGDVLEVRGYRRGDYGSFWGDADIEIPATEEALDVCLKLGIDAATLRARKERATAAKQLP